MKPRMAFLLLALFTLACSDDDKHTLIELVNDAIEENNLWYFVEIAPAHHMADVDHKVASSPSNSLAIRSTTVEDGGFSYWQYYLDPTAVTVGSSLTLKVKVKTEDVTGEGVYVALRGDKGSSYGFFVTTQHTVEIKGTQDFTEYSVKLDEYPTGITAAYIFLIMDGKSTGFVHFDDIRVVSEL